MTTKRYAIYPLSESDLPAAAAVCAQAMNDNPIHIRVFGACPSLRQRRLRRFFAGLLAYIHSKNGLYGAFADEALIGVLGMLPPKNCKPSAYDLWQLLPTLLTSNSPLGTCRLTVWLATWARLDPAIPHWHLGPLAVAHSWQRQGVGTQLMEYAINKGATECLYLETDKLSNVRFYGKFGFSILNTPSILAIPSWVMMRFVVK